MKEKKETITVELIPLELELLITLLLNSLELQAETGEVSLLQTLLVTARIAELQKLLDDARSEE